MKRYNNPKLEICYLSQEDVVTESGTGFFNNEDDNIFYWNTNS